MDDVEGQLKKFQSTFNFELNNFVSNTFIKETIDKLQKDDASTCKSEAEHIKINNFTSYLFCLLPNIEKSLEYCEKSLEIDPKNLTANVNKCNILLKNDNISDAEYVLKDILEIEKEEGFEKRHADAKADLAYAYSRAGPPYHEQAVEIYRKVISEYPYQYDWKFGLGLMLVRQTHFLITSKKNIIQCKRQMSLEAIHLFHDVAEKTKETDKILCGKAWIELGIILSRIKLDKNEVPGQLWDCTPKKCFDTALDISPDDPFVLQKCGQQYRYYAFRNIGKSEDLLRKATELHGTCGAYHHLALTLMKKVELEHNAYESNQGEGHGYLQDGASGNDLTAGIKNISLETESRQEQPFPYFVVPRLVPNKNTPENLHMDSFNHPESVLHDSAGSNWRGEYPRSTSNRNPWKQVSYRDQHGKNVDNICQAPWYRLGTNVKAYSSRQSHYGISHYEGRTFRQRNRPAGTRRFSRKRTKTGGSITNCLKNPTKVKISPDHPVLLEALVFLKRAVEISPGYMIKYDLALLYRQLDRPDEALKSLTDITNVKDKYTSDVGLVGVYEQKGMCNLDLLQKATLPEEKEKYSKNAISMLYKAILQQANFEKEEYEAQELKNAWHSYPTLKSLLQSSSDRLSFKMLARVHYVMKEHDQAIDVLETLKQHCELTTQEYEQLITSYVHVKSFQQAMMLLKYLQFTQQFKKLDRSLVADAYIKGALHAIKENDVPTAVSLFRDAYNTAVVHQNKNSDTAPRCGDKERKPLYELHIVHSCSSEENCSFLQLLIDSLTECTDMQLTVNADDRLGQPTFTAISKTMHNSVHIIIAIHPDVLEEGNSEMLYNQALVASKRSGSHIIVVIAENATIPDVLALPDIKVVPLRIPNSDEDKQTAGSKIMVEKSVVLQSFFEALCKVEASKSLKK